MKERIFSTLRTQTFRQSATTTVSTFLSAGLGAVFYLLLARLMGTSDYGLFTLSQTILILIVTVTDAGTSQGLVRFVGQKRYTLEYLPYASLAFRTKLFMGLVCWFALTIFASPLSNYVFHQPLLNPLLPLIGFGVLCYLLMTLSISLSQSLQKFFLWGGIQIGSNTLRLFMVGLFLIFFNINSFSALLIFSIACLSGFAISFIWLDRRIFTQKPDKKIFFEFWQFNKWTASFSIVSSIVARLDILLAGRFLSLSDLGSYSLAVTMVTFLPQISAAVGTVTASKFASFSDPVLAIKYLKKSTVFSSVISLSVGLLMIPLSLIVIHFTGPEYRTAFVPFLILSLSLILFMACNPMRDYLLYYAHKPNLFLWINLAQGLMLVLSSFVLIPTIGLLGCALSVLTSYIVSNGLCIWFFVRHIRQK